MDYIEEKKKELVFSQKKVFSDEEVHLFLNQRIRKVRVVIELLYLSGMVETCLIASLLNLKRNWDRVLKTTDLFKRVKRQQLHRKLQRDYNSKSALKWSSFGN